MKNDKEYLFKLMNNYVDSIVIVELRKSIVMSFLYSICFFKIFYKNLISFIVSINRLNFLFYLLIISNIFLLIMIHRIH
jgi:hypothetical protein